MHRKKLSPVLSLLLVAATSGLPIAASLTAQTEKAIAQTQSTNITLPKVPEGSTLKIDGAESMEVINQKLKELFGKQYASTTVDIAKTGTNGAIQAVEEGKIDLAAVGRSLTPEEKAKGLIQVPISRYKIAIVVSKDNPFRGDITFEQFAKIFRGEIKNWQELGGPNVPIKFIDRPENNYTRESFKSYPVFENAPFTNGANTVRMKTHETDEMVKALGKDGVGYAVIEQVKDQPDVHIVTMNKVGPEDERYPFSQPLAYVYKGPNPNPVVKAFLCTANTSEFAGGKEIVSKEFCEESVAAAPVAEASPSPATTATAPATTEPAQETGGGFPWWLLLLPLLAIPLFFLLRKKDEEPVAAVADAVAPPVATPPPVVAPPVRAYNSRISLDPINCKEAVVNWAVDPDQSAFLTEQGGRNLTLKLYDVTGIDIDRQQPHSVQIIDVEELRGERTVSIPRDDRDYLAEIGYQTPEGGWLSIARSVHSHVPACPPETNNLKTITDGVGSNITTGLAAAGAAIGAGAVAVGGLGKNLVREVDLREKITITPQTEETARVSWRVSEEEKAALRAQGGETLALRMHDATDLNLDVDDPHSTWEHECNEIDDHLDVPIPVDDKDYVAELGYRTPEGRWLSLARSAHTRLPGTIREGGLRTVAGSFGETISEKFTSVKENIIPEGGFGEIKDNISETFNNARENIIPEGGFGEIKDNIFDAFTSAKENLTGDGRIGDATSSIKNNLTSGVATAGAALGAGFAGIKNWSREKLAEKYSDDHIYLTANGPHSALVNWSVTPEHIQEVKSYGGDRLLLRIYDATGIDLDQQDAHSYREFECEEFRDSQEIPIPIAGRDYVADLGYLTADNHWLSIVRSTHTHISS